MKGSSKASPPPLKAGTRSSRLALKQTNDSLERLSRLIPGVCFETVPLSSPGDRDKLSDLRDSAADFFTKDLDEALLSGEIDIAVHSAKDLPENPDGRIDFLWLPWREDPRDAFILPKGVGREALDTPPHGFRIGVSSARREDYCRRRMPSANLLPVRGNIEERIAQLDAGEYDTLIMATAGLSRLGLSGRISEFVPTDELAPPPGQGYIAITFRKGDARLESIRRLFAKPVVFAGAGPGDPKLATCALAEALKSCEVCLYDSLLDPRLLELAPKDALLIHVGKRKGAHSTSQDDICAMLSDFARQGRRVLRLKGGDPGIFGRLAEETGTLESLGLPFTVIPGISSLQAATVCTGMLLTRRGVSRGFTVMTPRRAKSSDFEPAATQERMDFPLAVFMGASEIESLSRQLIGEGRRPDEAAAIVFGAGTPGQQTVSSTLGGLAEDAASVKASDMPGLILVGDIADKRHLFKDGSALQGGRILLVCSETIMPKAVRAVEELGGTPIRLPLFDYSADWSGLDADNLSTADWLAVSSPTCARLLLERLKETHFDVRRLPKLMVCGSGTAAEFESERIRPDAMPDSDFSTETMLKVATKLIKPGDKVFRLRSDMAGDSLAKGLESIGAKVHDIPCYSSSPLEAVKPEAFAGAFISSPSNAHELKARFGAGLLEGVPCVAIGTPTFNAAREEFPDAELLLSIEAAVQDAILTLAGAIVSKGIP